MNIGKKEMEVIKNDPTRFVELMFDQSLLPYQVKLVKAIAESPAETTRMIINLPRLNGRNYFRNRISKVVRKIIKEKNEKV